MATIQHCVHGPTHSLFKGHQIKLDNFHSCLVDKLPRALAALRLCGLRNTNTSTREERIEPTVIFRHHPFTDYGVGPSFSIYKFYPHESNRIQSSSSIGSIVLILWTIFTHNSTDCIYTEQLRRSATLSLIGLKPTTRIPRSRFIILSPVPKTPVLSNGDLKPHHQGRHSRRA